MDPIADMLIRLKNAGSSGHESVLVPFSNIKFEIAKILLEKGFIGDFLKKGKKVKRIIEIKLKYEDSHSKIDDVKRISKPSKRVYITSKQIWPVKQGYGISIISTSKGIMTGDEARKNNLGGEYICEVW